MNNNYENIRREYSKAALSKTEVNPDPVEQFGKWLNEALNSKIPDATAMVLSTCDQNFKPSSRIVLLKGFSPSGFIFYTNYLSRKSSELEQNPKSSLLFFWSELERQVRIEGYAEKAPEEEADVYFAKRPRASQISAWISEQSSNVSDRQYLESLYLDLDKKYSDKNIPRPPHWGGYRVVPDYFEFWQGRESRLHDRISYSLEGEKWKIRRLAP